MKIIYIVASNIPSRSANSIHVMKMCQAFAHNGHEVTLVVPNCYNEMENDIKDEYDFYGVENKFVIKKIFCPNIKGKMIFFFLLSFMFILRQKTDLIYGRYLPTCFMSAIFRMKTIFELHSDIWNSGLLNKIRLRIILQNKNIDFVVISKALKVLMQKKYPHLIKKIIVAHDGADKPVSLSEKIDDKFNYEKINVGYLGHLYKGRGIDLIINIANKIRDCDFHIIGGRNEDIEYWENQNLTNNIIFHGFIQQKNVYKYRNSCDILLAPYQNQVFLKDKKQDTSKFMSPLKIFEYMASKKAIIISDLPVLREVLNESNAIFVSPDNESEWINAINELKKNEKRMKLANQAYIDFEKKYTWLKRAKFIIDNIK